jgi:hypothetical protein
MTVLAATDLDVATAPSDVRAPRPPARPALGVVHDHDWRLVQVDWSDGAMVKEFACAACPAVWFA